MPNTDKPKAKTFSTDKISEMTGRTAKESSLPCFTKKILALDKIMRAKIKREHKTDVVMGKILSQIMSIFQWENFDKKGPDEKSAGPCF